MAVEWERHEKDKQVVVVQGCESRTQQKLHFWKHTTTLSLPPPPKVWTGIGSPTGHRPQKWERLCYQGLIWDPGQHNPSSGRHGKQSQKTLLVSGVSTFQVRVAPRVVDLVPLSRVLGSTAIGLYLQKTDLRWKSSVSYRTMVNSIIQTRTWGQFITSACISCRGVCHF